MYFFKWLFFGTFKTQYGASYREESVISDFILGIFMVTFFGGFLVWMGINFVLMYMLSGNEILSVGLSTIIYFICALSVFYRHYNTTVDDKEKNYDIELWSFDFIGGTVALVGMFMLPFLTLLN